MASNDFDAQQFSEMAARQVAKELSHPDLNLFHLSFAFREPLLNLLVM